MFQPLRFKAQPKQDLVGRVTCYLCGEGVEGTQE